MITHKLIKPFIIFLIKRSAPTTKRMVTLISLLAAIDKDTDPDIRKLIDAKFKLRLDQSIESFKLPWELNRLLLRNCDKIASSIESKDNKDNLEIIISDLPLWLRDYADESDVKNDIKNVIDYAVSLKKERDDVKTT